MHDSYFQSDDGFQTYRGPANWFSVSIPPSLQMDQAEAFLELRPRTPHSAKPHPHYPWSMTVYAAWVDADSPDSSAHAFDPSQLFPQVVRSRSGAPLQIPSTSRSWNGISRSQPSTWWQWLAGRRRTYAWRLWVIEHGPLLLVASLQSAQGLDLDSATIALLERVLESIEFTDKLAKPPELFRQEVLGLAQKHFPLLDSRPTGGFGIAIAGSEVNLSNFYRSYLAAPDRLREIVLPGLATMVRLQEWGPDQIMPPLAEVRGRIMPMLYSDEEADRKMAGFVRLPWVGGLCVMFVVDEDDTYRFVHERMLEKWKISLDDLHELALDNLNQFAQDQPLEVTVVGEDDQQQMLVPVSASAYNSSRLLGEQLHQRLRELLGPELILGIPNRDFFVAVSMAHPTLIGQVRQRVIDDYKSMHHPLTSRLLVLSADGVSEYCD